MKNNIVKFVTSILICQLAAVIGSLFTIPAINTWYAILEKPSFNPPNWVFGPAWTTLYVLMGIAAFLVWKKGWEREGVKMALSIFGVQLFLNAIWSVIFFGLKLPGIAFVEILMLWVAILYTIVNFYRISKLAGYLLLPYIIWVSFASILNFFIWWLN